MRTSDSSTRLMLAGLVALAVTGCGGGSSSSGATPPPPAPLTITGVAATGAAFAGGSIQLIDSTGTVVGSSSSIAADGSFSITLAAGARAPYVVIATRPGANGSTETLTSIVSADTQTVVNVTPVTTLIAALLSPSGDPTRLASELQSGAVQITPAAVSATVDKVQAILDPLLSATGTAGTNPVTGSFSADGTGYDRVLDSLKISIVPATTGANVEIEVKQQATSDTAQPTTVSFATTSTDPVVLPAVDATKLVESGTSTRIATFLSELTACYALPLTQRVSTAVNDSTAAIGTAADVSAAACRNVFDGNDPANYLSNGSTIGRNAANGGSFASLFRPGATGVVFSQGSYEFTRANGDLVIGYKSRDTVGNESFDTLVVRKTEADGKLRLIGNQYRYPGSIQSYHQVRQFPTLGQSAYSYRSVGYTVNVDNRISGGASIFDRVEVTTPRGSVLTLRPSPGFSYLPLVRNGSTLGTNFVRLRSEFVDPQTTGDIPAIDPNLFFSGIAYSDADITAIPSQAVWTYRYFLAGNTTPGAAPDAVQTYKTRNRALSIEEFKQVQLSQLNPIIVSDFAAEADPTTGTVGLNTDGPAMIGDAANAGWSVASGALPATSITIFGRYNGAGFNDAVTFGSTARFATVPCAPASNADQHCSSTVAGAYASGAVANGLHLFARDAAGREYANFYALYRLTLP